MFFSRLKIKNKFFVDGSVEFVNNGLLAKIRGKIPSILQGNKPLFSEGTILRKDVVGFHFEIEEESGFFWMIKKFLRLYRVREFIEVKIIDLSLIDRYEIIPTDDIENILDKPDDQKSFDAMTYIYNKLGFWHGDFIKNYEIKLSKVPDSEEYFVTAKICLDHGLFFFKDIDDFFCVSRKISNFIKDNNNDVAYSDKSMVISGINFINLLPIKDVIEMLPSAMVNSSPRKKIVTKPNDRDIMQTTKYDYVK